jgi:nucleoside-diphosphate-sugar epimerase
MRWLPFEDRPSPLETFVENLGMRLLVLGGTWFLGRAVVEEALIRGYWVTTFNRGRTGKDIPGVEAIRGDRTSSSDLATLAKRGPWDAVVDTSGMVPFDVLVSARILSHRTDRYAFISTVNVYEGWPVEPLTEESAIRECRADATEAPDKRPGDRYARLKAGCERAIFDVYDKAALLLRPGVILGPHEYIGRLPWWLRRIQRGGQVLAPGYPERPIQPIDVRDVAAFTLDALLTGQTGTHNVTAPVAHSTFGDLLAACRSVTGSTADLVWVNDDFLEDQGVEMWTEIPLWRTYPGTWHIDSERARQVGLVCRPLAETVRDTWAWMTVDGTVVESPRASEIGIDPKREAALLDAWQIYRANG